MTNQTFMTAMILSLSLSAAAEFVTVEQAYEVALSRLVVPIEESGSLVFRKCADCEAKTIRITGGTRFLVNGQELDLQAFRSQIIQAQDRDRIPVTVVHNIVSDSISSVSFRF